VLFNKVFTVQKNFYISKVSKMISSFALIFILKEEVVLQKKSFKKVNKEGVEHILIIREFFCFT